jgi:hypothetical protein
VELPVKVIHVVRDPFDNIATMYLRGRYPILRQPLRKCIDDFAAMTRTIEALHDSLPSDEFLEVHYEDLIDRPVECLQGLCTFLGVESERDHILSATAILNPSASRSRDRLVWSAPDVQAVDRIIATSKAHRLYAGSRPPQVVVTNPNGSARPPRHGPDFLVIGAQRCGTTLLHQLLDRHPEVYVPKHRKEIHFFDDHFDRGEKWYRGFFPVDRAGLRAMGEVSPSYLADARVPERIYQFDPAIRLIALVRHPIDRLWSAYHHLARIEGDTRSFTEFIHQDVDALDRGNYAAQLSRFADKFAANQLLVVVLEEFLRDPAVQLLAIQRFLGLREPWNIDPGALEERVNANFGTRYSALYRSARRAGQFVTDRLDQGRIADHIKQSRLMTLFKGGDIVGTMTPQDRSYLTRYYAPDVASLIEDFGVDAANTWGFQASTL